MSAEHIQHQSCNQIVHRRNVDEEMTLVLELERKSLVFFSRRALVYIVYCTSKCDDISKMWLNMHPSSPYCGFKV